MSQPLVCVVTGASRGVGRGVALALGAAGATVYVTGRSVKEGDSPLPGTVGQTAADVTAAGGTGIAVACDHGDDTQVTALFERVRREHVAQAGRIGIVRTDARETHFLDQCRLLLCGLVRGILRARVHGEERAFDGQSPGGEEEEA